MKIARSWTIYLFENVHTCCDLVRIIQKFSEIFFFLRFIRVVIKYNFLFFCIFAISCVFGYPPPFINGHTISFLVQWNSIAAVFITSYQNFELPNSSAVKLSCWPIWFLFETSVNHFHMKTGIHPSLISILNLIHCKFSQWEDNDLWLKLEVIFTYNSRIIKKLQKNYDFEKIQNKKFFFLLSLQG